LNELALTIVTAHVATFGERAVDVFYVTDAAGAKVTDEAGLARIRARLLEALGGSAMSGPASPLPLSGAAG
jgi:[protein-PII] uridylyltransferase